LRHKGYLFDVVDVADYEDAWCPLGGSLGSKTLPQVFVAGQPVGGFDEISTLEHSGDLDSLLTGAV